VVAQPALLMSAWMLRSPGWRIILPIVLLQLVHLDVYYGGMLLKSVKRITRRVDSRSNRNIRVLPPDIAEPESDV
jgi:hypothetical protein